MALIPAQAVEAAAKAIERRLSDVLEGDAIEWEHTAQAALMAASQHIVGAALRMAADRLEGRMIEPAADYGEQQYAAGYADAVARLILMPEAKATP